MLVKIFPFIIKSTPNLPNPSSKEKGVPMPLIQGMLKSPDRITHYNARSSIQTDVYSAQTPGKKNYDYMKSQGKNYLSI